MIERRWMLEVDTDLGVALAELSKAPRQFQISPPSLRRRMLWRLLPVS